MFCFFVVVVSLCVLPLFWELNQQEQMRKKQNKTLLELFLVITFHSCKWNLICLLVLSFRERD